MSTEKKLTNIIEELVKHVRKNRFAFYRTIFTVGDDVCWEILYEDDSSNIVIDKWIDGVSIRLVEFCTDYCFKGIDEDDVAFGSLEQRLMTFLWNEV